MAEIQPALTPEQWDKREKEHKIDGPWWEWRVVSAKNGGLYIGGSSAYESRGDYDASVPEEDRHAVAALALYGQPFGFTHADVKFLSEEAWGFLDEGAINHRRRVMLDIANRIYALLPPEAP